MKKIWLHMSLLFVSLASTSLEGTGFMDMGGFQIQVEEKKDAGAETGEQIEIGQEDKEEEASPTPRGTIPAVVEEQLEKKEEKIQQAEVPGSPSEEWEPSYGEEQTVIGQETEEIWTDWQQDAEAAEEDIMFVPEEPQEEAVQEKREKDGQELVVPSQDGRKKERRVRREKQDRGKKEKQGTGKEKTEEIYFFHEDRTRISGKETLAVRLEGEQEVCVLSCAVDHKECVYRWEQGYLIPLDAPLQKGLNCLEISVLLPDGQTVSMEPWYFSCGVGLAVL